MRPDYSKFWTGTALFDLFQDGGTKKKQRCASEHVQGREEYSESSNNVVTKVILQNTISSQKIWKLTVSLREKPFERRSREQSRAYSELSYELVSKILFKRLCANYQFRIVLFSIESFDSWLCLLGKEAKQSVERRSREPAEHIQSYLLNLDRQSCLFRLHLQVVNCADFIQLHQINYWEQIAIIYSKPQLFGAIYTIASQLYQFHA